jgi:predicted RNA binding protein YcfA (HicA-like mRNA interferase family)
MPRPGPIKRKDLMLYLYQPDFEGSFSGGKHQFMVKENITLRIPHPHQGDIGEALLLRILKQANIERDEWEKL